MPSDWYLGLDIGTSSIAATLLNRSTGAFYPIGWIDSEQSQEPLFQLPAVAYFGAPASEQLVLQPDAIAWKAFTLAQAAIAPAASPESGLLAQRFKSYLNVAIPYFSSQTQRWEPWIQLSEQQSISLQSVHQALASLLATLTPAAALAEAGSQALQCVAHGLAPTTFAQALGDLAGVVISHSVSASDAYQFNLREAVLASGLVTVPESIFFVEEVLAALIPAMAPPDRPEENRLQGNTLVLSAGAIATDLLLATVPTDPTTLQYRQVHLRRLPYAGNALDQDIICQMLYPRAEHWDELNLSELDLPISGEPDLAARFRLQQRLEGVALGQRLLNAVRQIKPALSRQDTMVQLDGQSWMLKRQDLHNWVIAPYLQQLNRELELLLKQADVSSQAVQQVICTGGTGAISAIAQWLQQKFPQARLIWDSRPDSGPDAGQTIAQRVAQGLALLPQYPKLLNRDRHRYNEYFVLREVLNSLKNQPDQPFTPGQMLSLLQAKGLHIQSCQATILQLLEGHLPPGLLPSRASAVLLTSDLLTNPDYQDLTAASLFSRLDPQRYRLNSKHRDRLWHHLEIILANTYQTLEEPLTVGLDSATVDG